MKRMNKILSAVLVLAMVMSLMTVVAFAAGTDTYSKVTDGTLTSGKYILVSGNNALTTLDGTWLLSADDVVKADKVVKADGAVWTLTVSGNTVKLTDPNGKTVAPKGGTKNGIKEDDYSWTYTSVDGAFKFAGQGSDAVTLAINVSEQFKGRAYQNTTVSKYPEQYFTTFILYKLDGEGGEGEGGGDVVVPEKPVEADIATVLAAEKGKEFIVKAVVNRVDRKNIYVQDATGNMCIRMAAEDETIKVGDTITATGARDEYKGTPQLKVADQYAISDELTLTAKKTTVSGLTDADVGFYVEIENLTVKKVISGDFSKIIFTDAEGKTIELFKPNAPEDIAEGAVYNLKGCADKYKENFQLRNSYASEFTKVEAVDPDDTTPETDATTPETDATTPETDAPETKPLPTTDKLYMYQGNNKKTVYATGNITSRYLEVTENPAEAADIFKQATEGGFYLYFEKDGKKQYITVEEYEYEKDGEKKDGVKITLTDDAVSVFNLDAELEILVTKGQKSDYYLGSYKEFDTISASKTKYVNADNVNKTQFRAVIGKISAPQTSDNFNVIAIAISVVCVAAAAVLVINRKKITG